MTELWLIERVACWVLAFAFACYLSVNVVRLTLGTGDDLGTAGLLFLAVGAAGLRIVYLEAHAQRLDRAQSAVAIARAAAA